MFDASLRRRSLWKSLGPLVASSAEFRLRESDLVTHDFSIPFACPRSIGGKQLRVILLAPSALEDGCRQETISRLDRFSSLTGGRDIVIAFLHSEEPDQGSRYTLHGLLDLQSMLLQHIAIPIPILAVPHVNALFSSLQGYIKDLEKSTEVAQTLSPLSTMPTSLLSHAVATAPHLPLSEHDTNVLSDLFPSFRALSQALMTPEGRDTVREYFDEETARGIIEFWSR